MKKLFLLLLLAMGISITFQSRAQVSLNVNIGSQPQWGPVGYDHVDYYYLPDIESYYYVPKKQFIYLVNGGWVFTNSLPPRYSGYDLYSGYKVVINSPEPYRDFTTHKVKYAKFKGNHGQSVIAKSKNKKYIAAGLKGNSGSVKSSKPVSRQKVSVVKAKQINKGNGKRSGQGNGKGKH